MSLLNAAAGLNNGSNNSNQNLQNSGQQAGNAGQTPEDQRLLAAMFLERLNKQQQQGNQSNNTVQQQQPGQVGLGQGGNFPGSSMPSLQSLTASSSFASHPSALSNFNFGPQAGGGQQVGGGGQTGSNGSFGQLQSPNNSAGSLSNNPQFLQQQMASNVSLTTLTGGRAPSNNSGNGNMNNGAPQLNFNTAGLGGASAGSLGGGMGGNAMAGQMGGGANGGNPTAMNALLADYLRRTSGTNGGGAGAPTGNGGENVNNQNDGGNKTEASC